MATKKKVTALPIDMITIDKKVQLRRIEKTVVTSYTEDMKAGAIFPALTVFNEKGTEVFTLADGQHRLIAAERAGLTEVDCVVKPGTWHDAFLHHCGANTEHGYRRTNKEKRKVVEQALLDPELEGWSFERIGDLCRVSPRTVSAAHTDLQLDGKLKGRTVVTGKDGKEYPSGPQIADLQTEENQTDAETPAKKRRVAKKKTPGEKAAIDLIEACRVIRTLPYPAGDMPEDMARELSKAGNLKELNFAADVLDEICDVLRGD